jgi:glycosyltransferase involved in cell wall biosynthesis
MNNKKQIIIIRNSQNDNLNGTDRFPVFLAESLISNGYEVSIVSQSAKILSFARDKNIKTIRGRVAKRQDWNFLFLGYLIWQGILTFWYWGLFVKKNPDIIHVQSRDDFIAATIAGKLLGKKVIWTDPKELKYIWKNTYRWFKNPIGKMVHWAARFADKITVFSESERSAVNENIDAGSQVWQKIKVVYNGITDSASQYKKPKKDGVFQFCLASHLIVEKGVGEAINAFNKFSSEHKNVKLIILGDGPDEVNFREEAEGNSAIEFLGRQDSLLPYIGTSDVFIRPTYHEGFSMALVEAGMLSCPIIATAVGGNMEVVKNNETGILLHPKDALALYDAMDKLYKDSALCQKIAKNARTQYEKLFQFDKTIVNDFIPLYENNKK